MDGGGEDGVELAKVCELPGDIGWERIERLGVFGEEGEGVGRGQCSWVARHSRSRSRKADRVAGPCYYK